MKSLPFHRSRVTNQPIQMRDKEGNDYAYPIQDYYRELFWNLGEVLGNHRTNAKAYRRLRLATQQYELIRSQVQSLTTFELLESWLNFRQWQVYLTPFMILDDRRRTVFYRSVKIKGVNPYKVDHTARSMDFYEEEVQGEGWNVEFWFFTGPGRFDMAGLKQALAGWGIYVYESDYGHEGSANYYRVHAHILRRDFKLTDANNSKWKYTGKNANSDWDSLIDEDEDDDEYDAAKEAELTAQWYEDGYLDSEIEGLFDERD